MSWQREMSGQASFEAAQALATAAYRVRERLREGRYAVFFFEGSGSEASLELYRTLYAKRLQPIRDAEDSLDSPALTAETLWGPVAREAVDLLRLYVTDLTRAMGADLGHRADGGHDVRANPDWGLELRYALTATPNDSRDALSAHRAIRGIEKLVKPHFRRET